MLVVVKRTDLVCQVELLFSKVILDEVTFRWWGQWFSLRGSSMFYVVSFIRGRGGLWKVRSSLVGELWGTSGEMLSWSDQRQNAKQSHAAYSSCNIDYYSSSSDNHKKTISDILFIINNLFYFSFVWMERHFHGKYLFFLFTVYFFLTMNQSDWKLIKTIDIFIFFLFRFDI